MRNVLCLLGRHIWEVRQRRDSSEEEARYEACRRCGKQTDLWNGPGKPGPTFVPLG